MRNAILAIVATLLVPSIAHAEYATPRRTLEVRPSAVTRLKLERELVAPPVAMPALTPVSAPTATPTAEVTHLSIDEVLGKINTVYMTGMQRCYRKSLASDPMISGKVTLDIRVNADGRAVGALATDDASMDRCMSGLVANWKFTAPATEKEGTFRISLVLASN